MNNSIGKNIKARRERLGWSQAELAHNCGWEHQSRISGYELGNREPKQKDLTVIATALGCSINDLYSGAAQEVRESTANYDWVPSDPQYLLEFLEDMRALCASGKIGPEEVKAMRAVIKLMGRD